jgi:protein involved in polysaccharide export with SLBB domain
LAELKKTRGKRSRFAAMVGFLAPFVLALTTWVAMPATSQAQVSGFDPLSAMLGGRNGAGGLFGNGVVDTTNNLPQSQVLRPQLYGNPSPGPSRLEQILSARAGVTLHQFGYDQVGLGRAVIVPETGAVQDDYIMGPGDEVVVALRGQENSDFRTTVDRNGSVVLPRLPPVPAGGRTFGDFRHDLEAAVHRAYVASNASVSIGRVRQISVLVSGEVNAPGLRLATGLSSAMDVLLLSGGVKKTGSLRNITVRRGDHSYTVDLYSILTGGGAGGNLRLADGDRVIVPPLGATVAVTGLVRRPGIYELPPHASSMSARALLALAGGQEVRGRYRLSVLRIEPDGRINLVPVTNVSATIRDSEILRVELNADLAATQATLSGGTGLAGQYAVSGGAKLSDVIRAPGALGLTPYTLFGIIVRKDPRTLLRTMIAFTPAAVLNGKEDMTLQSEDMIRPLTVAESQLLNFIVRTYLQKMALDQAKIRNPLATFQADAAQSLAASSPTTANGQNAAAAAAAIQQPAITPTNPFGLQPGALDAAETGQDLSSVPADLQRSNIVALLDVPMPGTEYAKQQQLAYQQHLQDASGSTPGASAPNPQQLALSQQNALMFSQFGTGTGGLGAGALTGQNGLTPEEMAGAALAPGQNGATNVPSEPLPPNYMREPANPSGYASNREIHTFGELARQLDVDPLVLVNFLIDHRARLDGAVRGPGSYFVGPSATLDELVQAAGGTISWADESGVQLLTTAADPRTGRAVSRREILPLHQGMLASYVVHPRDQIHFNQIFTDVNVGQITVQGEVRFPGTYPITRGEHLSDILMRAGGLTRTAYPAGTVFLRKSAAQLEQEGYKRAADEIQSQLLAGMARIGNDKITGEGFTAIQGFITQLRTQKALGRIAIAADPSVLAAHPALDPLLEGGDVIYIPQRPSTVAVLGEVMQPGSYAYQPGLTVDDYVRRAGGYAQFSNEDLTFIVQPDGSARKIESSWLSFGDSTVLPPGSSIVVPRDLAPLTARQILLDVSGIFSSFAVTAASLAVLAKQ